MKIFQSIILLLLSGVLFFSSASLADEKTKITFLWWSDPGGGFEDVISDFKKENPDIDVEMIKGPASTDTRETMYTTAFLAGGSTYDMALMDIVWVPRFAKEGWIIPLDDWFSEEERKEFLPGDIQGSIYGGKIYRIPLQTDAGVLYYRKDLLEQKGYHPPETWDEFVKIAKDLQNPPSLWGFVFQGKQYEGLVCNFLEILWSFGGDVFNEEGELVLNSPQGVQALKFMSGLIHTSKITPPGVTTYEEEESRHIFQEGHAVFCRNWPYLWSLAQKADSPIKDKIAVAPLPYEPARQWFGFPYKPEGNGAASNSRSHSQSHKSEKKSRACLGGWGFGISKFTKNKGACIKFLKFITGYEAQKRLHLKSGIVPTRKALFEDRAILEKSPFYSELYQILLLAKPRPARPDYAQVSDILRRFIHKALLGEISPKAALEKAESEIKKIK